MDQQQCANATDFGIQCFNAHFSIYSFTHSLVHMSKKVYDRSINIYYTHACSYSKKKYFDSLNGNTKFEIIESIWP